jgi:hypothetical protein
MHLWNGLSGPKCLMHYFVQWRLIEFRSLTQDEQFILIQSTLSTPHASLFQSWYSIDGCVWQVAQHQTLLVPTRYARRMPSACITTSRSKSYRESLGSSCVWHRLDQGMRASTHGNTQHSESCNQRRRLLHLQDSMAVIGMTIPAK